MAHNMKVNDLALALDPAALDKACIDLIYISDTQRSASLRERIGND
jgi:uncharacterized Fe-S center protein